MTHPTIRIPARDLRVDDIVVDADARYEVTSIDSGGDSGCMGVTMHGYDDEFVYRSDEAVTVLAGHLARQR